jgi:hypothetical protein
MQRLHKPVTPISSTNRSRVSNGTLLLQGIDGRSASARRFRDLIRSYSEDFDVVSEADETLVRTAAMLTLALEGMTAAAAIEAFWQQLQDKRASSGQLKHFC